MENNKGTVIQVMGPVLDIRFSEDQLPELLSTLVTIPFAVSPCPPRTACSVV